MLDDKNFLNKDNRNLSEVFKELQEMQNQSNMAYSHPSKNRFKTLSQKKTFNFNRHYLTLS